MQYTATIEPNEKYRSVINASWSHIPDGADAGWRSHDNRKAAREFARAIEVPHVEETEHDDLPALSWDMISVSSDPDLCSQMATYFDGIEPGEPTDLIRAKLRLVDVEVYANAQIAAQTDIVPRMQPDQSE